MKRIAIIALMALVIGVLLVTSAGCLVSKSEAEKQVAEALEQGKEEGYQNAQKDLGMTVEEAKAKIKDLEGQAKSCEPISPPEIIGEASGQELMDLLNKKFPDSQTWRIVGKPHYNLTSIEEIKRYLAWDKTNEIPYTHESSDFIVPDYAFRVLGRMIEPNGWSAIPAGVVWGTDYAGGWIVWNIFVTREEGKLVLYLINPLKDEITGRHVSGLGEIIFPEIVQYIPLVWIK